MTTQIKKQSPVERAIKTLQEEIKSRRKVLTWLKKHKTAIGCLPFEPTFWMGQIDFNHLKHGDVRKVMRAVPAGKWSKSLSLAGDGKIDYTGTYDGFTVRCYAGEPPPSCRIVEEVVEIPAQPARFETVRKLVCPKSVIQKAA